MPLNLLLIGPPGVGKGTQAALLTDRLGLLHLASGDVFRLEIATGTKLGIRAKRYIDKGQLVPDDVTIAMMESRFTSQEAKVAGFVLDGFPRTVAQAAALDAKLESLGIELARVVSLEIDDETVVQRLGGRRVCTNCGAVYHVVSHPPQQEGVCDKCGAHLQIRSDDVEETIRKRLAVFRESTKPVLDHYDKKGLLQRVDGTRPTEEVFSDMIGGLVV